jgi:ABC-type nitrate/sulfonate/bicarbonate transport system ATPase subunit
VILLSLVVKDYPNPDGGFRAPDVNLENCRGEFVSVIEKSGMGKDRG